MSEIKEIQVIDFLIAQGKGGIHSVDIRSYIEFNKGFISKSVNIDMNQHNLFNKILDQFISSIPENDKIIMIIEKEKREQISQKVEENPVWKEKIIGFVDIDKYFHKQYPLDQAIQYSKKGKILANQIQKDFFVIDIRNEKSFEESHVYGAKNIKTSKFLKNFSEIQDLLPRFQTIYIYGKKQEQVSFVLSILKKNGYNNVMYINMYQIEDLLHKNGLFDSVKKVIPEETIKINDFNNNASTEQQDKQDDQESQNNDQQGETQQVPKIQFNEEKLQSMLQSPPDNSDDEQIPQNMPDIQIRNQDYKQDSLHDIKEEEMDNSKKISKEMKEQLESPQSSNTDRGYKNQEQDQVQETQKSRNEDSESCHESEGFDMIEIKKVQSQKVQQPLSLMSRRSFMHEELQLKNSISKKDDWKDEKEMEGFTLQHILKDSNYHDKKTKIICTMGPACWNVGTIIKLIDEGMNICRLNFSHGTHESHYQTLQNIHQAQKLRPDQHVGILLDTKGPEIRTGFFEEGVKTIEIKKGQNLKIVTDYEFKGNSECIACSYKDLPNSVKIGGQILIADGSLVCIVKDINEDNVIVEVQNDCKLGERKNMNLPGCQIKLPTITEKDEEDIIEFGLKHHVDFIALSFARSAADIEQCRDLLGPRGSYTQIIAKIENQEGLQNYVEICKSANAIMIARGDLGMEIQTEKIFVAQKWMTKIAHANFTPVVCATQMFESMINNPRPTRAEASDVANAVLDGVDCVMLSGETANGSFPIECVKTMSQICREGELCVSSHQKFQNECENLQEFNIPLLHSLCINAVLMSFEMGLPIIICFTVDGAAARYISKLQPKAIVIAISDNTETIKALTIQRGITCFRVPTIQGPQINLVKFALQKAYESKKCQMGQEAVVVHDNTVTQGIRLVEINEENISMNNLENVEE